ncbi:hypothetical protein K438DRAFT_1760052 [Mycena galopus ATCC 62051]|nr:hypothetical protein K438DRAFT_1760052 [Mycena galopus ATCC 62051]
MGPETVREPAETNNTAERCAGVETKCLCKSMSMELRETGSSDHEERVEKVQVTTDHVTFERIKATWSGGIRPQTGDKCMDSEPLMPTTSELDKDMPLPPPNPKLVKAVDQARKKVEAAVKVVEQKKRALVKVEASDTANGMLLIKRTSIKAAIKN